MSTQLFGEILTLLVVVSALCSAAVSAGVGLDAWWSRCEAKDRRSLTGDGCENTTE